jgi:hypothetical protein
MEPSNSQERMIAGYKAAVAAGWTPEVPAESRCKLCPKPHLPFTPWCDECAEVLSRVDRARIIWLEEFVDTALYVKLYCTRPGGRFGEDSCGGCPACRLAKMAHDERTRRDKA